MMEKSAGKTSPRQLGTHRKAFKSILLWEVYEAINENYWKMSGMIALSVFKCIFKTRDLRIAIPSDLLHIYFIISFPHSVVSLRRSKKRLATHHISLMTAELQKARPGVSEEAWNQVALELNDQLYHTGIWRSPYFFYDGNDCQNTFRELCLVPLHKKVASEHSADLEKGASAEQDTALDQETANRLCAIAYEKTVRSFINDTIVQEPLQISSEFSVLPRELYSKLYFNIRFLISDHFLFYNTVHTFLQLFSSWKSESLWLSIPFFIAFKLFTVWASYSAYSTRKVDKLGVPDRVRILTEIMRTKPKSCDVETWDTLAKRANQWLHAQGTWEKSDEFFFDGEEYKEFYRRLSHFGTRYVELDYLVQEVKTALEKV